MIPRGDQFDEDLDCEAMVGFVRARTTDNDVLTFLDHCHEQVDASPWGTSPTAPYLIPGAVRLEERDRLRRIAAQWSDDPDYRPEWEATTHPPANRGRLAQRLDRDRRIVEAATAVVREYSDPYSDLGFEGYGGARLCDLLHALKTAIEENEGELDA